MKNEKDTTDSIWITDVKDIPTANLASLKRALITLDGRGLAIKQACVEALIERAYLDGYDKGYDSGFNEAHG